jgi:hypothetical protein
MAIKNQPNTHGSSSNSTTPTATTPTQSEPKIQTHSKLTIKTHGSSAALDWHQTPFKTHEFAPDRL